MIRSVTAFQRSPVPLGGPQLGPEVYRRRPITMLLGFICPRGSECSAVHGTILLKNSSQDRKSTRLNSSHYNISYAVFCLKKKQTTHITDRVYSHASPDAWSNELRRDD